MSRTAHAADLAAQVEELDRQGMAPDRIARQLGITRHRVEWILDELAGWSEPLPGDEGVDAAPRPAPPLVEAPAAEGVAAQPITAPAQGTRRKPAECGTVSGYQRHLKLKETPCDPCRQASAAYQRERKARRRAEVGAPAGRQYTRKPIDHGTRNGYESHRRRGEQPCSECTEANREASQAGYRRATRERVRVVWLAPPAGAIDESAPCEYAVLADGRYRSISAVHAAVAAAEGETVYVRHAEPWQAIPMPSQQTA